jgi:hypothetical protein
MYEDIRAVTNPSSLRLQPFHVLLRVGPYTDSKHDLRKAFHESSLRFHPDKIGQRNNEEFHRLRTAYDILLNKRESWAYRRIGPDVATNPLYARCSTREDFRKAAMESAMEPALTPSSVLTLASSVVFMKGNSFVVRTSPTFQRRHISIYHTMSEFKLTKNCVTYSFGVTHYLIFCPKLLKLQYLSSQKSYNI